MDATCSDCAVRVRTLSISCGVTPAAWAIAASSSNRCCHISGRVARIAAIRAVWCDAMWKMSLWSSGGRAFPIAINNSCSAAPWGWMPKCSLSPSFFSTAKSVNLREKSIDQAKFYWVFYQCVLTLLLAGVRQPNENPKKRLLN